MKKLVVLIITLILASMHPSILQATSLEVSGPVSGSWSVDTVFVTGDIKVESGESLTIGPGTLVLFTGHFKFTVLGSVVAAGTENGLIRFSTSHSQPTRPFSSIASSNTAKPSVQIPSECTEAPSESSILAGSLSGTAPSRTTWPSAGAERCMRGTQTSH
jgi:hypothetical protein